MNFNDLDAYCGKLLDSGRFKVVNVIVYDYSWNIEDLAEKNKRKLLFKIKLLRHLKILRQTLRINSDFVWKWYIFKEDPYYFAVEDYDYYQVMFNK